MKVFVFKTERVPNTTPTQYKQIKTGPFPVLKISVWSTNDDFGHCFLIQDGLTLRTVGESSIELATPLDEALL